MARSSRFKGKFSQYYKFIKNVIEKHMKLPVNSNIDSYLNNLLFHPQNASRINIQSVSFEVSCLVERFSIYTNALIGWMYK